MTNDDGRVAFAPPVKVEGDMKWCARGHVWMADLADCPYCAMTPVQRITFLRDAFRKTRPPEAA